MSEESELSASILLPKLGEHKENAEVSLELVEKWVAEAESLFLRRAPRVGAAVYALLRDSWAHLQSAMTDVAYLPPSRKFSERIAALETRLQALDQRFVENCLIRH